MNKNISGIEYETVPEPRTKSCYGCVCSTEGDFLCKELAIDYFIGSCVGTIWKEVKMVKDVSKMKLGVPMYTVDEVLDVLQLWSNDFILNIGIRNQIKQTLETKSSPEYKEYLKLKEKFKGVK
jgi:hypothetical protein